MAKHLICDIQLGGSTEQYLTWSKRNLTEWNFIQALEKAIGYRAKTKAFTMSRRVGALIGITYEKLDGDPYILDCIIEAFNRLEMKQQVKS